MLYGLYDVLGSVGLAWPDVTSATSGDRLLDVRIVAATAEPFRCYGGVRIEPHDAIADVTAADAVVVCDMFTPIDAPPRGRYVAESAWLRAMHERGALIASVCAGSLLLAESGLLDGRSCAGHWAYVDLFAFLLPSRALQGGLDPRPLERGRGGRDRRWRDVLAGARALPHRALLRAGPRHADGQDLPPRGSPGWSAAVLGDDSPVAPRGSRRRGERDLDRGELHDAQPCRRDDPALRAHAANLRAALPWPRLAVARSTTCTPSGSRGPGIASRAATSRSTTSASRSGYADPTFFRRLFKRVTGLTPAAYRRMYAPILRPG